MEYSPKEFTQEAGQSQRRNLPRDTWRIERGGLRTRVIRVLEREKRGREGDTAFRKIVHDFPQRIHGIDAEIRESRPTQSRINKTNVRSQMPHGKSEKIPETKETQLGGKERSPDKEPQLDGPRFLHSGCRSQETARLNL